MDGAFRENRRRNPRYGDSGSIIKDNNLKLQFRGYSNADPPPPIKQQKCMVPSFYQQFYNCSATSKSTFLALLYSVAFFLTCFLCECSKASGDRKTELYKVKIICFLYGIHKLSHNDPNIINAKRVTRIFIDQKNGERMVTIS